MKACLEAGAHHIDLSGEPQYLETIQLRYHEEAERKGVYVVGSCGFDSIPADLGSMVLAQDMVGDVATIETYLKVTVPDVPGPMINFATWQSAIHGFAHAKELGGLRKQLYPERMPKMCSFLRMFNQCCPPSCVFIMFLALGSNWLTLRNGFMSTFTNII